MNTIAVSSAGPAINVDLKSRALLRNVYDPDLHTRHFRYGFRTRWESRSRVTGRVVAAGRWYPAHGPAALGQAKVEAEVIRRIRQNLLGEA